MIDTIVRYLQGAHVPFRMASYPSEGSMPTAAHPLPGGALLVDARLVLVDGKPAIACFPDGERIDYAAIGSLLGGVALEGTSEDLPGEFRYGNGPVPPLGQLLGLPVVIDERAARCTTLVFRAFHESVYIEIPYDEWARLEQPRLAAFSSMGELPAKDVRAAAAPAPAR